MLRRQDYDLTCALTESIGCWTEVIFSASSSGISHSNSSSRAITSSTVSSESAPRSSTNDALLVTSSSLTPSCSTTIFLTRSSMVLMGLLLQAEWLLVEPARGCAARVSLIHKADSVVKSRGHWHPRENAGHSEACAAFGVLFGSCGPVSGHVHAAVHVQGLAGDVAGVRAGEEGHGAGDVRRFAEAAQRDLAEHRLLGVRRQVAGHVGVDEARGNHVHGHAAAADLLGQRLAEGDDAGLGRGVVGLAGVAGGADHRGDVDDAAL